MSNGRAVIVERLSRKNSGAGRQQPITPQKLIYQMSTEQQIESYQQMTQYYNQLITNGLKQKIIPPSELIHLPEAVLIPVLNHLAEQAIELKEIDKENISLPYLVVRANKVGVLKALVRTKIDWNGQDLFGNTAAHLAVQKNSRDMMSLLLDAGANFELPNRVGESPADWAAKKRDLPFHYSMKGFHDLAQKINELANYGQTIKNKEEADQVALLVTSLRAMLKIQRRNDIKDDQGIKKFKMEFKKALHRLDDRLTIKRDLLRILIFNILLALTMVGSAYVIGKPLYSKLWKGKMSFFAQEMTLGYYFEVDPLINRM